MTGYIDTSVLLRLVLREAGALDELRSYAPKADPPPETQTVRQ